MLRITFSLLKVWSAFPKKFLLSSLLIIIFFVILAKFQESIKADLYVQICFPRMTSRTVNRGKFKIARVSNGGWDARHLTYSLIKGAELIHCF